MNTPSEAQSGEIHQVDLVGIALRLGTVAFFLALNAALLFLGAGRLNWTWAWIYLGICLTSVVINGVFLLRTGPGIVAERGRGQTQIRGWDRLVSGLWGLTLYIVLPLVAGLDVRFGWSEDLGAAVHIVGAALLALGLGLAGWAMIANAYFSTAIRIQNDRGHTVCRTGPYHFVRHPGYAGFMLQSLGTSFLLGSLWALIPGIATVVLGIIRTSFEDRILQAELTGYSDFVKEIRYRLIPGIW